MNEPLMTVLALSENRERLARAAERHRQPGVARQLARQDLARRLRKVADRLES